MKESTPLQSVFFFVGGDKRKSSATHTKDFCGKNVPKLPDSEEKCDSYKEFLWKECAKVARFQGILL
jgi:hypothetical protein